MTICILNGNPSAAAGNGFDAGLRRLAAALEARGQRVEELVLRDLEIRSCRGCFDCWLKTPGQCVLADDGARVCRAVLRSDLLLLASPLIMGFVSAQLKLCLDRVIPRAEALGVQLLIEPEPDLLMERTSEIKPFVAEIQAPSVGINFDIGHFYCAGEDPAAAFEELFPWVGHVHIEDIAPTREHNHLIAGLGAIDFPSVFAAMQRLAYRHDMSLELYPYTDRPDEAGEQSLAHLLPMLKEAGLQG